MKTNRTQWHHRMKRIFHFGLLILIALNKNAIENETYAHMVYFYSFVLRWLVMWNGNASLPLQEGTNEIEQPRNCQISFVIALSLLLRHPFIFVTFAAFLSSSSSAWHISLLFCILNMVQVSSFRVITKGIWHSHLFLSGSGIRLAFIPN